MHIGGIIALALAGAGLVVGVAGLVPWGFGEARARRRWTLVGPGAGLVVVAVAVALVGIPATGDGHRAETTAATARAAKAPGSSALTTAPAATESTPAATESTMAVVESATSGGPAGALEPPGPGGAARPEGGAPVQAPREFAQGLLQPVDDPPVADEPVPVSAPARPALRATSDRGTITLTIDQPSGGGPVGEYSVTEADGRAHGTTSSTGVLVIPAGDCTLRTFTVTATGPGGEATSAPASGRGCVPPGPPADTFDLIYDDDKQPGGRATLWAADPPSDTGGAAKEDLQLVVTWSSGRVQAMSTVFFTSCGVTPECPDRVVSVAARNLAGTGPALAMPVPDPTANNGTWNYS